MKNRAEKPDFLYYSIEMPIPMGYHTKKDQGGSRMSYIPSPTQAEELLKQYNREPFHIQHAETVSKVMGEFAKEYDPDRVDFWRTVGMLHDIDFEQWPDQHCAKADKLLRELAIDEDVIHATDNEKEYLNGGGQVMYGPEFLTVFSGRDGHFF